MKIKMKNYLQDWYSFLGKDSVRNDSFYRDLLQKMFPELSTFSEIDWNAVSVEYFQTYPPEAQDLLGLTFEFPEYLQIKAEEEDCPPYLFELAYYELAEFQAYTSLETRPEGAGFHLNPTATFLNFEFDIKKMLEDAQKGEILIHERPHVLCISRHAQGELCYTELTKTELDLLLTLEAGPQMDKSFVTEKNQSAFQKLMDQGVILSV
jgi:hypothetical protein